MTKPRRLKHRFPWSGLRENVLCVYVFGRPCQWTVSGVYFQCSLLCSSLSSALSEFQPLTYGQVIAETSHSFKNGDIRESPSSTPCQQGKTPKSYYLSFLLLQKCRHSVAARARRGTSQQLGPDGWLTACAPGCTLVQVTVFASRINRGWKEETETSREGAERQNGEGGFGSSKHPSSLVGCTWLLLSSLSQSFSSGEGFQLPLSVSGRLWTP